MEMYISRSFLNGGCYFQQIISAIAKEYLIAYNFSQRAPEAQNLYKTVTPNATLYQMKHM